MLVSSDPSYGRVLDLTGGMLAAQGLMTLKQMELVAGKNWTSPLVNILETGHLCMEWWVGSKKATLEVSPSQVRCLRVWGADMDTEMSDEILETPHDFEVLWAWLTSA